MRVLVVTNMYPPHHYGGYELSCRDVVDRWRSSGHEVLVLTSDLRHPDVGDPPDERAAGVWRDLSIAFADGDLVSPPVLRRVGRQRADQRHLARALREARPDVVSVWHMGALSFGLLATLAEAQVPLVYVVCDDWLSYGPQMDPWMRLFSGRRRLAAVAQRVLRLPTRVPDLGPTGAFCFVSDLTRRRSEQHSPWTFPLACVTYSGIDRTDFPSPAPPAHPWAWRLLYVGRLDERKGVHTAIDSLGELPEEARLDVLGRGDPTYLARLQRRADEIRLADRVVFDEVERPALRGRYAASDVVVFPTEWEEPFGLVPLEAMASGVPVVATGLGGSAEFLVDGYNCLLVPPRRPDRLADAVCRLAADPDLRERLRQGGEATAAELTVDRLATVLEEWHAAAAGRFGHGRPPDRPLSLPVRPRPAAHPLARHQAEAPATLASGDAAAIKRLYWDLGGYWEETHAEDLSGIPLLSRPETHPVVVQMLEGIRGRVLDAGCGPRAALAVALAIAPERMVVALDIGLGTVRLARAGAAAGGVALLGVVGDVEQLPFRDEAFDGVVCDDTLEHLPDDVSGVSELGRVLGRHGRMVLATPNRHSAVVIKQKLLDLLRGRRHPAAHYFVSTSHIREYSWTEFETLVRPVLQVRRRAGVGWDDSRKRRIFSRFVGREPVRRVGQMIVLEVGRPDETDRMSSP